MMLVSMLLILLHLCTLERLGARSLQEEEEKVEVVVGMSPRW